MAPIRLGSGTGVAPSGFAEWRKGDGTVVWSPDDDPVEIPDGVVHQYVAEGFGTPWEDQVGSSNMAASGLTYDESVLGGEPGVSSDGDDDTGDAEITNLGAMETWGIAFTAQIQGGNWIMGELEDSNFNERLMITIGSYGSGNELDVRWEANGNRIGVSSSTNVVNTGPHLCVVNKTGNTASDIEIYVDDMSTNESTTEETATVDHTEYGLSGHFGFYALRRDTGFNLSSDPPAEMDAGIFEINTEPYSQSEREAIATRRPEV